MPHAHPTSCNPTATVSVFEQRSDAAYFE